MGQTLTPFEWLLANVIVLVSSFVQASVGIGFAMIAVPLLALIDLAFVPGPSLLAMLALSLTMLFAGWRDIDWQGIGPLMGGLALGTLAGAWSLGQLSERTFSLAFGSIVLLAVGMSAFVRRPPLTKPIFAVGGLLAGFMGTISGIHGAALAVIYQGARPASARATIALIFVIASIASLTSLYLAGLLNAEQRWIGISLLPGLFAGLILARFGRAFVSATRARQAMLLIAGTSAALLIASALRST